MTLPEQSVMWKITAINVSAEFLSNPLSKNIQPTLGKSGLAEIIAAKLLTTFKFSSLKIISPTSFFESYATSKTITTNQENPLQTKTTLLERQHQR
ncbi:hypothetical protein [Burkholderia paludis]|uniref:hypothetical protein n=1 Tax=Burkholderia paludis TaxID=1506587 RepID=UPI00139F2A13|nr:hypothetical protein [Burkholderia paludis]